MGQLEDLVEKNSYVLLKREYKDVLDITELLRISIEKLDITYLWNDECYPVTISIGGICGCISDFNSSRVMYLITDEELYKAKNEGRNKVFLKHQKVKTPSFYYDLGGRYINWKFVFVTESVEEAVEVDGVY